MCDGRCRFYRYSIDAVPVCYRCNVGTLSASYRLAMISIGADALSTLMLWKLGLLGAAASLILAPPPRSSLGGGVLEYPQIRRLSAVFPTSEEELVICGCCWHVYRLDTRLWRDFSARVLLLVF